MDLREKLLNDREKLTFKYSQLETQQNKTSSNINHLEMELSAISTDKNNIEYGIKEIERKRQEEGQENARLNAEYSALEGQLRKLHDELGDAELAKTRLSNQLDDEKQKEDKLLMDNEELNKSLTRLSELLSRVFFLLI